MTDRFYSSHYGKHSTYYGMNSSSLYGSNFSSVFADAPPPLDDFHEEDDDMVFRNSGKSSPKNEERTSVASNIERQRSSSSPNKMLKSLSNGNDDDNDFGDFSGFANFSSAFSTSDCSEPDGEEWCAAGLNEEKKFSCTNNTSKSRSGGSNIETTEENANREMKSPPTFSNNIDGDAAGDEDDFADFEGFNGQKEPTNSFGSVSPSWSSDNGINERQTPPLSPEMIPCNGIQAELNQITEQNDELEDCDNLNGEDFENVGEKVSNDKISNIERKSSNSFNNDENTQGQKYKYNESKQRDLQQSPNIDSNAEMDNFSNLISNHSFSKEKTPDYKNDPPLSFEQTDKSKESNKPEVPEDDDAFGEFTSINTNQLSVFSTPEDNAQSLIIEKNCTDCQKNIKHDISNTSFKETLIDPKINSSANEAVKNKPVEEDNDFGSFNLSATSLDVDVGEKMCNKKDRESSETNEQEAGVILTHKTFAKSERTFHEQVNEESKSNNQSCGDFDAISTKEKSNSIKENTRNLDNEGVKFAAFEENNFGDDPIPVKCDETTRMQKGSVKFKYLTNDIVKNSTGDNSDDKCDDFGDFNSSGNDNFGAFADFEHKENTIDNTAINSKNSTTVLSDKFISNEEHTSVTDDKSDDKDDDFGDFNSSSTNKFGAFADFEHKNTIDNTAITSKHSTTVASDKFISNEERTSVTDDKSDDKCDDFGDFNSSSNNNFGAFADFEYKENTIDNTAINSKHSTTVVPDNFVSNKEHKSDDFASFSSFGKSSDDWASNHDNFGDFSSSQTGVAECRSAGGLSDSRVPTNMKCETKEGEAISFSHGQNIKAESAISDVQWSTNKHKSKPEELFKPGSKVFMGQTREPVKVSFTSRGQLSGKGMKISPIGSLLSTSSVSDMWKELQSSSKNGSIRFQWLLCHSQHKQLLSLDVVPDHLPVTSLLFPGEQGQKKSLPFMIGPGFVSEPDSSSVISFRTGVKDIDPSQDPFGAPPEVGLPDLSFGFSNSKFPDFKSENGSSSAMALDLDFLATPSTPDMTNKQEHKSIYDEDLLGLDMGFSLDPQGQVKNVATPTPSPKSSDSKDLQKVFKFGNVTIPLEPSGDEKKLSDKAKEIVSEIEDLSFMLSSVLMFPLKSR